ncbi:MAG: transglutaminase family protein, partial [Byssovorax sp.]
MSIHVAIHHVTTYRYDRPVTLSPQVVRLRPAPHCRSRVLGYSLHVLPGEHFINWQQDPEANYLARLVFPEPTRELRIEVDLVAEMAVINPFDFFLEPLAERWPFQYEESQQTELAPYRRLSPSTPLLDAFVATIARDPRPTNDFLVELNQRLSQHIRYVIRLEHGLQTPEETLEKRSGSCRDTAWLLVQILRRLDLAARFVSGYLVQLVADAKPLDDGPAGPSADFTDLHAWCEVYLPGAGWIGLDPTSGLFAGEGHLPLACTPEPSSAAPVSGLLEECETTFEHEMTVTRVWEAPRVTRPYTDDQWAEIETLGHAVDEALRLGDVRLTMGGEPTFVAIDDPDGEEWNTAALGPDKKRLATDLFHRMRAEYAPKGLVHFGQGKWYPGEPLPRWSLNCFWRRDGEPLWSDTARFADEAAPSGADEALAGRFLRGVAERLGLDPERVFAAHEDVFYNLWREHTLPVNVDPLDSRLDDPLERERLRRLFSTGLDKAVGHVLPIARRPSGWRTGPWHLRGERGDLLPGDSPVGLRLPLASQPWLAADDRAPFYPPDPGQDVAPLPAHADLQREHVALFEAKAAQATNATASTPEAKSPDAEDRAPAAGESATWINRSAICAEPRAGVLYVFMPPVDALEDYVALVSAVEATAAALGHPVMLEGYEPPRDPRVARLSVTPDPGVIEVNIHPAASWNDLVAHTTHLYEAARLSRLAGEKFLLDGRHTGTGGGNHIVLGGATVNDSPFLRRPDLLRSLIAYW